MLAPTGSGKTLAAFLWCIDRLIRADADEAPGVRVVYVSPLKALVHDVERNLRAPLAGVHEEANACGEALRLPRVAVRTGDTPARERRAQSKHPAEILVTTPESLYLILGSQQRSTLESVHTVIVDEIHALAPTKRGAHLSLSLERLCALTSRDPQRIGLSATARPREEVARFLGGDRPVEIIDATDRPRLDLRIVVPVADMERPEASVASPAPAARPTPGREGSEPRGDYMEPEAGLWPALIPRLLEAIRAHRSTLLFVNSRGLCERLTRRLNELAGEELVQAHHGSVAHEQRREIEDALKQGRLRGIVATSSLELGIDMGAIDLVLLVESPGAVARGLQRVGRAGHQVGEVSRGLVFPKHRGDLLEATVVARGMMEGAVEALQIPRNPLDVLAQQIVAHCGSGEISVEALEALLRRSACFRDLSREALLGVLDMLAGRYPSTEFAELRARIVWDRQTDRLSARSGALMLALTSGGTIPDRGQYAVHLGAEGPRIGELDEEMVHETRPGQTITLGASTWRVEQITRDRVVVRPAPGEIGRLPFWRGEGPGRPIELGRALGAFVREIGELEEGAAEARLVDEFALDPFAARNLIAYLAEQRAVTGVLPTDRAITLERFRDELGDWRICIHTPFGVRLHAPWALALERSLRERRGQEAQAVWSDDGIALRFADADEIPGRELLIPDPDEVEDLLLGQLGDSALFASEFRENAARALLLPRRRPGARTPLWIQRLRAQNLPGVARRHPSFPIMLETYRSCLQDVFDMPALRSLLDAVRRQEVRIDEVETRSASPFARSLVFAYTAAYLYQGDVPSAERRAQALSLDRAMLRDLLGETDLRELLDPEVVAATASELQGCAPGYRAQNADALHDLLRRVGDLDVAELSARSEEDPSPWIDALAGSGRAVKIWIGGGERWIAAEDAAVYRDALGVTLPSSLPRALLEPASEPMEQLLLRYARTHVPFESSEVAQRFALVPGQVQALLGGLEARGRLQKGELHPEGRSEEWCDVEVLRKVRRRTLARLRHEVAAVDAGVLARFLPRWHGVEPDGLRELATRTSRRASETRLREALARLEGLPLSFQELERVILPTRVPGYEPRMLDELGAAGEIVWVGFGALGERDGRIALFSRERVALLLDPPDLAAPEVRLERAVLDRLRERGASFPAELLQAIGQPPRGELETALWDLVFAGLVTNDTFAPLRALSLRGRAPRRGRPRVPAVPGGRWSLVGSLLVEKPDPTEQAHARALTLLERHGVVSRDVVSQEFLPGGFASVYPVFQAMEESGRLRRGHFVKGLSGAQFAFAGVVDRLRDDRERSRDPRATLLAATDPASPYGATLPWPPLRSDAAGVPRRAAGATVVSVQGEPVLYLEAGGRRVLSFEAAEDASVLLLALAALRDLTRLRRRSLRVERVDGEPAQASPSAELFLRTGFRLEYKGLVLDRDP
jgi:ATP-dependent Lhr-like helicase